MIQFNLLPDVKQQYIKAKNLKRTAVVISMIVAASALFIFVLLFTTVNILQKKHLSDLSKDIKTQTATLKNTPDLDKVLTIQNQLKSLPDLHNQKPVVSRLFTYIAQLTPAKINIGKLDVDFDAKTINITGTADALSSVNQFVDTMKFTTYAYPTGDTAGTNTSGKAFTGVVLGSFGRTDKDATYQISLSFDPLIFDSSKNITLTVPKITSTRSETEKPTDLFKALPATKQP